MGREPTQMFSWNEFLKFMVDLPFYASNETEPLYFYSDESVYEELRYLYFQEY